MKGGRGEVVREGWDVWGGEGVRGCLAVNCVCAYVLCRRMCVFE